jgi:hypothetical protein
MLPATALRIHLCIGQAYAFSGGAVSVAAEPLDKGSAQAMIRLT